MDAELAARLDSLLAISLEKHPDPGTPDSEQYHFCDSHECDWQEGRDARLKAAALGIAARYQNLKTVGSKEK